MHASIDSISIFDVAQRFGVNLHGKGKLFSSPFREDKHPSFSIFKDGTLYKDLATGEVGNATTFLANLKGVSNKEAYKILLSEFGKGYVESPNYVSNIGYRQGNKKPVKGDINAPEQLLWDDNLAKTISERYCVAIEALKLAFADGCFGFAASSKTGNVWLVSDSEKLSYQIRKMDGSKWKFGEKYSKAWTLKNSYCSYPLGLMNAKDKKYICLCEGSTDFLTCYHILLKTNKLADHAPIALLGANHKIGLEYLRHFKGKKVIIFADNDIAGLKAGRAWNYQLRDFAEQIVIFKYPDKKLKNGKPINDLNDYLRFAKEQGKELNPFASVKEFYE